MIRVRVLAAALLLSTASCAHRAAPVNEPPPAPIEAQAEAPPPQPPEEKRCAKAKAEWLRQQAPSEGSILIAFQVSKDRREQIEQLNHQIAQLAAALETGCLEKP